MSQEKKINIVIVSKDVSSDVLNCLDKLNNQKYKNFFVTLVIDNKYNKKLPKSKYKTNILISQHKNMSYKRNLAVKKFKSDLIAFLDSDAYPIKDWLFNTNKLLNKSENLIIGGPSVPFPKQSYWEMIAYYSKRSFYVTGYLNFRKYRSADRYCDWVESCNMMVPRKLYIKNKGMNKNIYLGEDKEFIERTKNNNGAIKVFFSKKLTIFHRERSFLKFLIQRFVFGMDLINITKFQNKIRSFQPLLPLFVLTIFILLSFLKIELNLKIPIIFCYVTLIQLLIFFDIRRYIINKKILFYTLVGVNLANISYIMGNIAELIFLKNYIVRKIYLFSRTK